MITLDQTRICSRSCGLGTQLFTGEGRERAIAHRGDRLRRPPEHWHYQMTSDAIDAGKHVYCEKPMTQNVEQAKRIVAKMKSAKVKMQVGVQGMSDDSYETAHKYIQDSALGKVVLAQIDYSRNYKDDFWAYPIDPDAQPGVNLDLKAWLGPAPMRAFFEWVCKASAGAST